jgi:hypothetical protein
MIRKTGKWSIRKVGAGWTNLHHVSSRLNPDLWYRVGTKKMKETLVELYLDADGGRAGFIHEGKLYEQTWKEKHMTERSLIRRAGDFVRTVIFRG